MASPVDAGSIYSDVRIRLDKLNGDILKVQTSLDKITKKSTETAKKSETAYKKAFTAIKAGWLAVAVAVGIAARATFKFLKESEAAASDAQEVYAKFEEVFISIRKEAETTAITFADSFGVAESTAKELLSATGDILVGFGFTEEAALSLSKQTNELAADLASFTNFEGGTARASAALTKALVGESESVKALGIVIRQDTAEYKALIKEIMLTNNVSQIQAKALAALQIATEQSGKALGDYARTSESAANVQKRLKEQSKELKEAIGEGLLPTVTAIRRKLGEWAEAITEVIKRNNELRDAEKAAAAGTNTREQAILLLERERDVILEQAKLYTGLANAREEDIKAGRQIFEDTVDSINEQIRLIQGLKKIEDDIAQAKADEDKAEENRKLADKARLEEQQKFTNERIRQQGELQKKFAEIEEQRKLFGDEFDARAARESAVRNTLNELIEFGFTAEGAGIERILDQYGQYLEIIEEIDEAQAELTANAVQGIENRVASQRTGVDLLEEEKESLKELIALYAGPLTSAISAFSNLAQVGNNNEIIAIDKKIAALEAEGESTEELEKKKRDILLQNWKLNKSAQFSNALINTAAAIAAALPNIPLSIIVGAAGLAQAAAIQAQQPPNLQTGGIILPQPGGRLVNVAENGFPELALNSGPSGQDLLGQFADQIVSKMGGGSMNVVLVMDSLPVAKGVANQINNGNVKVTLT